EGAPRHGDEAGAEPVALRLRIEGDHLLRGEHAQDVQTRARDQLEGAGDRVDAEGLLAPTEEPEDGDGARDGGDRAHPARAPPPTCPPPARPPRLIIGILSLNNGVVILPPPFWDAPGAGRGPPPPRSGDAPRTSRAMARLTEYPTYRDAHRHCSPAALW